MGDKAPSNWTVTSGDCKYAYEVIATAGLWASAVSSIFGFNLPLTSNNVYDENGKLDLDKTTLSLTLMTKSLVLIYASYESLQASTFDIVTSFDAELISYFLPIYAGLELLTGLKLPTKCNNSMGIPGNVLHSWIRRAPFGATKHRLAFPTDVRASLFESFGMGATYLAECLDVSHNANIMGGINKISVRDLAVSLVLYDPNYVDNPANPHLLSYKIMSNILSNKIWADYNPTGGKFMWDDMYYVDLLVRP